MVLGKMKKLIITTLLVFSAGYTTLAQTECPVDRICITRESALKALQDSDTVKAQEAQIAVLKTATDDLKAEIGRLKIELAEKVGQLTTTQQNAVSDRAIIEILLKSAKKKCLPFSVCF